MMGLMQLFRYPSQNTILKTVSEGLKSGKKDPGRKQNYTYYFQANRSISRENRPAKHLFISLKTFR
jgi:hypothetical protein